MNLNFKRLLVSITTALTLTACGSDSSSSTSKDTAEVIPKNAKAQLGVLANASVKIFEVKSSTVLFTEQTSSGKSIGSIGNFNAHEGTLEDNKYYIYEVSGGDDWDANDDGKVDDLAVSSKGKFRLLVKGSTVKGLKGKITVTAISEILYQKVKSQLEDAKSLDENIQTAIESIVKTDINKDGKIDQKDILQYDPVKDEGKLFQAYQDILPNILDDIHSDREIDLTLRPVIKGSKFSIASNVRAGSVVGKLETIGVSVITDYVLSGEGSQFFKISNTGEITTTGVNSTVFASLETINLIAVASNNAGNSNEVSIVITIIQADTDAPVFISTNTLDVKEGAIFSHQVQVKDASSVTYTLEGDDVEQFTVSKTGFIHSNNVLDFEAIKSYSFIVKAVDSANNEAIQTLSITVLDVIDIKPVITGGSFEIADDLAVGEVVGQLSISELGDGTAPVLKLNGVNAEDFSIGFDGIIKVASPDLNYQTKPRYTLKATATNEAGESEAVTVIITVKKIVYIRFISATEVNIDESTQAITTIEATGLSTSLSYSIDGGVDAQHFNLIGRKLSFKVAPDYEAPADANTDNNYEIIIKIADTEGHSITKALRITVKNKLDVKPVLASSTITVAENKESGTTIGQIIISNAGDSAITKTTLTGVGSDKFSVSNNGNIKLNSPVDFETKSSYDLTVVAANAAGDSNNATLSITVTNVNDAPVAAAQSITLDEDTAKTIVLSGSDEDQDTLTYQVTVDPVHGVLSGTTPNLMYTPHANYYGDDYFTFIVNDGKTNSVAAVITLKINDVEEPDTTKPVITLSGESTPEIYLGATYSDAGATATDNKDGTITVQTSGTVNTSETGTYEIVYTAQDQVGNTAQESRLVKVVLDPNKERVIKFLYDPLHGHEPWITDGTEVGTYLLKDTNTIRSGISSGSAIAIGDTVYFSGFYDGDDELWKTDGTPEGTVMVKNINPNGLGHPFSFTSKNGKLLFKADDGVNGIRVWESDGTEEGTVMLDEDMTIDYSNNFLRTFEPVTIGNKTIKAKEITVNYRYDLVSIVNGVETLLTTSKNNQSIVRSSSDNHEKDIKHYGSYFYFGANYISDGTKEGTISLPSINRMKDIVELNNKIHFINDLGSAVRGELYKMNRDGSHLEKLSMVSKTLRGQTRLVKFKNKLYFNSNRNTDGDSRTGLWVTDGTVVGTHRVTDKDDNLLYYTRNLTVANNFLYFEASTPETGLEIWMTDGTKNGTRILKDVRVGSASSRDVLSGNTSTAYDRYGGSRLYPQGDLLYFYANSGDGYEPYISDGTSEGTHLIKDLNLNYTYWAGSFKFTDTDVYIAEDMYSLGQNKILWKTDGTDIGTEALVSAGSKPIYFLKSVGSKLFFIKTTEAEGQELWVTTGSRENTKMVKDIRPGSESSGLGWYRKTVTSSNKFYFAASDGVNGSSLWESDGTEAGTVSIFGPRSTLQNEPYLSPLGFVNGKLLVSTLFPSKLYLSNAALNEFTLLKNIE